MTWGKHAGLAAQELGKPHLGICCSSLKLFRGAYVTEPMFEFDGECKMRNTRQEISSDVPEGLDAKVVLAKCLQGKATNTGRLGRFGAFLPEQKSSVAGCGDDDLDAWLSKEGQVTVISLGSQSVLSGISAWAESDLLKGCLEASPRVLISSAGVPEDPELKKAEADGRLRSASWLPLWGVLGHPNVSCFVSHCGANSTHECLARGKAIVPLPFFDDQYYIAQIVEELMGYASQSGFTPVRKQCFRSGAGVGVP